MEQDIWKWLWNKFGFLRGMLVVLVLLALLERALQNERGLALEFTHAIIWHWDHFSSTYLAPLFSMIPGVPEPSVHGLNLFIFSSIVVSAMMAILLFLLQTPKQHKFQRRTLIFGSILSILITIFSIFANWTRSEQETEAVILNSVMYLTLIAAFFVFGITKFIPTLRPMALGMLSSLTLVATMEALYFAPVARGWMSGVVESAKQTEQSATQAQQ